MEDIERKQLILIDFLKSVINNNEWNIKAEYSTNDSDKKVILVQEQTGQKVVFYGDIDPLYNYYSIDVFGTGIRETKNLSLLIQNLIGSMNIVETTYNGKYEKWEIIIKQFSNYQPIEYQDIRRIGYNATMQCIISKIYEEEKI